MPIDAHVRAISKPTPCRAMCLTMRATTAASRFLIWSATFPFVSSFWMASNALIWWFVNALTAASATFESRRAALAIVMVFCSASSATVHWPGTGKRRINLALEAIWAQPFGPGPKGPVFVV